MRVALPCVLLLCVACATPALPEDEIEDTPSPIGVADCAGVVDGSATLDDCGVCDSDLSNDCVSDCAGQLGGSAAVDGCGVCDTDPTNDCGQDCAGTWGGDASTDACGTCDAEPANDCVQDCAGVYGGASLLDHCGVCDADASNDCPLDCNGVWGGTDVADNCGSCDADPSNDCVQDCSGAWGGAAVMDSCNRCVGGATGEHACVRVILEPEADARVVAGGASGTNFGNDNFLMVDAPGRPEQYSFVRFNLSSLGCGGTVVNAELELTTYTGKAWGGDGQLYATVAGTNSWIEAIEGPTGITWNNKPGVSGSPVAVYPDSFTWYDDNIQERTQATGTPELRSAIENVFGTDSLLTLRLHSPGYKVQLRSREYADHRPRLIIDYVPTASFELAAEADATLDSTAPTTPRGASEELFVGAELLGSGDQHVLLRFNLSDVPPDYEVTRARLFLSSFAGYAYDLDGNVYTHFVDDDGWDEATVTWNTPLSYDGTAIGYWWLWYNYSLRDDVGVNASTGLRDRVISELAGDKVLSVLLRSPGYDTRYRSREYATDPTKQPRLQLCVRING